MAKGVANGPGKSLGVGRRDQARILANEVGHSPDGRGHYRYSRRQGLQNDHRGPFGSRTEHQQVKCPKKAAGARHGSVPGHPFPQPQTPRFRQEKIPLRAIPENRYLYREVADPGQRLQKNIRSLFPAESARPAEGESLPLYPETRPRLLPGKKGSRSERVRYAAQSSGRDPSPGQPVPNCPRHRHHPVRPPKSTELEPLVHTVLPVPPCESVHRAHLGPPGPPGSDASHYVGAMPVGMEHTSPRGQHSHEIIHLPIIPATGRGDRQHLEPEDSRPIHKRVARPPHPVQHRHHPHLNSPSTLPGRQPEDHLLQPTK